MFKAHLLLVLSVLITLFGAFGLWFSFNPQGIRPEGVIFFGYCYLKGIWMMWMAGRILNQSTKRHLVS